MRERTILELIDRICDKDEWERKVFDDVIVDKYVLSLGIFSASGDDLQKKSTFHKESS